MKQTLCLLVFTIIFSTSIFAQTKRNTTTTATDDQSQNTVPDEKNDEIGYKKYNVQLNYSTESLSRNLGIWRTTSLYMERKFRNRQIVWMNYTMSDRKSVRDQYLEVGTYKPLKNRWAITAEAGVSPTHKFAGKFSVKGEVEKGFANGFVIHGGSRLTVFTAIKATTVYAQTEKYWGSNRAAYTLSVTNITTAGTAPSHRFSYNRYYGERVNNFGVAASFGRENENLGLNAGILRSQTWSVSVSGKHWLTNNFAVNVNATLHRQGTLYYRRGLNFGFHYRF